MALRTYCLDCQSLWLDETASAYWTSIPLGEFFLDAADNLHVPGYYLALRAWVDLVGLSAFSLRYLSLLGGLLLVPTAYSFTQRVFQDRFASVLAAAFAALSPAHVYYSQETRMYAIMPVLFLGMLLLVHRIRRHDQRGNWALMTLLGTLALYLHLFSVLMLMVANVLLAVVWWQNRARRLLRRWLISQSVITLLIAPWLWFTWRRGGAIPANLVDTSGGTASFTAHRYVQQIWHFLLTGMTDVRPVLAYWSSVAAILLAALLVLSVFGKPLRWRWAQGMLLVAIILPFLAGAFVWRFNPLTHPRYLFFLIGPLSVLIGIALAASAAHRPSIPLIAATIVLLTALDASSHIALQSDVVQHRYDAASLSEAIKQRGGANAIVLMPPYDRSLWYYDPSPVEASNWPYAKGMPEDRPQRLQQLLQGYSSVFLVEYHDLYAYDLQEQIPFLLEANGHLLERFTVDRMDVSHYALAGWDAPKLTPRHATCGPVHLIGSYFPKRVEPGNAPALALRWELGSETESSIVASARLVSGDQVISSADRRLLTADGAGTANWTIGTVAETYFSLPLPLGSFPQAYNLRILLYEEDGDPIVCGNNGDTAVSLGQISLTRADRRTVDAYGTWSDTTWFDVREPIIAPGLELEGFAIRPRSLLPAEPVHVSLRWRATGDISLQLEPQLQIATGNEVRDHATGVLFRQFPTTLWQDGDLFIETREMNMPVTIDPVQLRIVLEHETTMLASIGIDAAALAWDTPAAAIPLCAVFEDVGTLRGANWQRSERNPRQSVLTLYWEGSAGAPADQSYTVFAQLLAPDGWVQDQDDGLPAEGERPTTTWLPGEVIADAHQFLLPPDDEADVQLSVGLYDLSTLNRVPASSCRGRPLRDNALTIPLSELR